MKALIQTTLVLATACLAACASGRGLEKAMSDSRSEPKGNSHAFHAPPDVTLGVVTGTFVQRGFTIDQSDATLRLVKASRDLTDPKDPNTNYHITATAYVTGDPAGSLVTLAASQQTLLHRKGHSWTMVPILILPVPIPTGSKYETVTTGEGSILAGSFYGDFFDAVERGLANASTFNATTLAAGAEQHARAPEESARSPKEPAAAQAAPAAAVSQPH
jgi:hypothetical protein